MDEPDIIEGWPEDLKALERLYRSAFPDEDLWPLVTDLATLGKTVLSFSAIDDTGLVGHVAFTFAKIGDQPAALLAPLCVSPNRHGMGIGSNLVQHGLARLQRDGITVVMTLGDPNYYGRFGFKPDSPVIPPYPLPEAYHATWQDLTMNNSGKPQSAPIVLPEAWLNPALWTAAEG